MLKYSISRMVLTVSTVYSLTQNNIIRMPWQEKKKTYNLK